jgi:hypothetical protein
MSPSTFIFDNPNIFTVLYIARTFDGGLDRIPLVIHNMNCENASYMLYIVLSDSLGYLSGTPQNWIKGIETIALDQPEKLLRNAMK